MLRRELLIRFAGALAAVQLTHGSDTGPARTKGKTSRPRGVDKLDRIAVSSWSFHRFFQATRPKDFDQPGAMLALLDFPEMVAKRYKVHRLEFVAPHFASTEPSYLMELKSRLLSVRSHLANIPVDIPEIRHEGGLSDPDPKVRESVIDALKTWSDIAAKLGARSVRCDPGRFDPEKLLTTIESYKKLAAYGKTRGIQVIIENHGKIGAEHPEALVKMFKSVNSSFIGALPDFGNFPDEATREKGLAELFPFAKSVCHAKGLEFDANGNETKFDFRKCVEISKKAGFKGVYSIEYEGREDPYEGVQKVVDELLRYL
jgi:sugar phosphate isomerase/epimerase